MARTYVFRLTAEGVRELEQSLKSLGETGERAFAEIGKRVPGLEGAFNAANKAVDDHRERQRRMADQVSTGLNSLVTRYLSVAAAARAVIGVWNDLQQQGELTSASMQRLTTNYEKFLKVADSQAGRGVAYVADLTDKVNDLWIAVGQRDWVGAWRRLMTPGVSELPPGAQAKYTEEYLRAYGTTMTRPSQRVGVGTGASQYPGESPLLYSMPMPTPSEVAKNSLAAKNATLKTADDINAQILKDTAKYRDAQLKIAGDAALKLLADEKRARETAAKEEEAALKDALEYADQLKRQYADEAEKRIENASKKEEDDLKAALEYAEQLRSQYADVAAKRIEADNKERDDAQKKRDEEIAEDAKKRADAITDYWRTALEDMTNDGRDFFADLFEHGEADLKDFLNIFKRAWANLLADLVTQRMVAPIMQSALGTMGGALGSLTGGAGILGGAGGTGLFAGLAGAGGLLGLGAGAAPGYYNTAQGLIPSGVNVTPAVGLGPQWFSGGAGSALGGGLSGLGIGGITGMVGGNSTGGMIGGAVGGVIGNMILPGIGGLVGGALGGLAGGFFGGKPSNYRATATFGPGGGFALSGDKPNEQTTALAQQAAAAIQAEVAQLHAFGIEFQKELSNIWIGQRDASSFQLVGGGRVGVGTVGDPADLARDAVNALLQGATSSDPVVAAQLSRGYASIDELKQALTFATGIGAALQQITDPLGYAIELWKKEAQARLDMASATGVSLEKTQQLNAALWNQQFGQINAGLITSIGGYLQTLHYGPDSAASPQQQYGAALKEYERSKQAAMTGGPEEAQKYLEMTQTFLPVAREFLGTTQAYSALEHGAESTLQGLMSKLAAPAMPDLVTPLVAATTNTGAATVDAVDAVASKVDSLRESVDRLFGEFGSLMRQVSAT